MPEGNRVVKIEIVPEEGGDEILDGQSRILNWAYNHLLERGKELKGRYIETQDPKIAKTLYTKRGLRNLLPNLKQDHPFLKTVHSSPLKNAALRLTAAIQDHQKSKKGKRKGKHVGFPKFRAWKQSWFSLLYDEPTKGFKIDKNILTLSLGVTPEGKRLSLKLQMKSTKALKGQIIRNLRITKELGKFYAIFTARRAHPPKKEIKKIIAFDPNHKNFAYGVDSRGKAVEIASPNWLKKYDKRLDELKSKRDRCNKQSKRKPVLSADGKETGKHYFLPSKRWNQFNTLYLQVSRKRREQTKTFLYTLAHRLFKEYDCVAVGNYTPHGGGITKPMRRAMNNRSLIGRGKEVLSWVAQKSGKTFIEYDEKGTTRTCHICDYTLTEGLDPKIRNWQCPYCYAEHHRDENAAQNGLDKTLQQLKDSETIVSQVSGSDRPPVTERWAWCVTPSGVACRLPRGRNGEIITAPGNSTTSVVACDQKMTGCQV